MRPAPSPEIDFFRKPNLMPAERNVHSARLPEFALLWSPKMPNITRKTIGSDYVEQLIRCEAVVYVVVIEVIVDRIGAIA